MASKKKQSEGIALLSMYNDEEDDEMEDVEGGMEGGEQQEQDGGEARIADENLEADTEMMLFPDSANEATLPAENDGMTPEKSIFGTSMPQQPSVDMLDSLMDQQLVSSRRSRTGTVTIVDYGHDEVAMSPEPEDGGLDGNGRVMFGEELQTTNDGALSGSVQVLTPSSQVNTPQFSEPSHTMQFDAVAGSDGAEHGETAQEEQKFVDSLDKFLPPPPRVKCSEDLQRKINKFLEYKRAGKSFNAEVRNREDYRNPDFLLHAVRYQDIDQIGSCFDKDVFDPHGYDPSDYYDEIEADMRRESDRKEQEKKKAQKVEFASGGAQPGIVTGVPRINVPVAGSTLSSGGLHLMPPTVEPTNRDGRQNKKSKWDKARILYLLVGFTLQFYLLLMLVVDTCFLRSKNDERQRREGQLKGRKEDHELHSVWFVKLILPPTIFKCFRLLSTKLFVYSVTFAKSLFN